MIIYFSSDIRPQCRGVKVFSYNTLTLVITSRHSSTLEQHQMPSSCEYVPTVIGNGAKCGLYVLLQITI